MSLFSTESALRTNLINFAISNCFAWKFKMWLCIHIWSSDLVFIFVVKMSNKWEKKRKESFTSIRSELFLDSIMLQYPTITTFNTKYDQYRVHFSIHYIYRVTLWHIFFWGRENQFLSLSFIRFNLTKKSYFKFL